MNFGSDLVIKLIQFMLAPAVMISACGLLLLGTNNKYSAIANRIRLLNEERRRFLFKIKDGKELDIFESTRFSSIMKQLEQLSCRLNLVRNSIISYSIAIFLFIVTSLLIGLDFLLQLSLGVVLMLISFISGMIAVGLGILFVLLETTKGFEIINLEIKAED